MSFWQIFHSWIVLATECVTIRIFIFEVIIFFPLSIHQTKQIGLHSLEFVCTGVHEILSESCTQNKGAEKRRLIRGHAKKEKKNPRDEDTHLFVSPDQGAAAKKADVRGRSGGGGDRRRRGVKG